AETSRPHRCEAVLLPRQRSRRRTLSRTTARYRESLREVFLRPPSRIYSAPRGGGRSSPSRAPFSSAAFMGTEPQRAVLERVGDSVTNWREDWPRLEKRDRRCARFRFRA